MHFHRFVNSLVLIMLVAAFTLQGGATSVQARPPGGPTAVLTWNASALRTVVQANLFQVQSEIYMAYVQAAVYDAVVAIEGGYQPYGFKLKRKPNASVDAAVAAAAHDVLVHYFPVQQPALDADYAASLATVANGPAKDAGILVGQKAAAGIIAFRQGDGLEANIGFTMPLPAPGVWQLPAGQTPQTPWVSKMRPFMLTSPDQFRPGPPPALGSNEWAVEYNEVKTYGRVDSTVRTAEQADIARFFTTNGIVQYNTAYKEVTLDRGLDVLQTARLYAMGNLVGADSGIACFDAKYHYLFWRPIFAIRQGDTDGNPATVGDPTWSPLVATPNHPEYVAAHGCFSSAQAEVFAAFLDTENINIDLTSTVPNLVKTTRHFRTVDDLVDTVVNARVWGGIHYRQSVVLGARLGRKVAEWTLERFFQPDD